MKLTSVALRAIADNIEGLANILGKVTEVEVHGYIVELEREESQMDGISYVVTGIYKKDSHGRTS